MDLTEEGGVRLQRRREKRAKKKPKGRKRGWLTTRRKCARNINDLKSSEKGGKRGKKSKINTNLEKKDIGLLKMAVNECMCWI